MTFKLFKALDCGYRLLLAYEIWHFDTVSDQFFKGYVNTFLKMKQEASGDTVGVSRTLKKKSLFATMRRQKVSVLIQVVFKKSWEKGLC